MKTAQQLFAEAGALMTGQGQRLKNIRDGLYPSDKEFQEYVVQNLAVQSRILRDLAELSTEPADR